MESNFIPYFPGNFNHHIPFFFPHPVFAPLSSCTLSLLKFLLQTCSKNSVSWHLNYIREPSWSRARQVGRVAAEMSVRRAVEASLHFFVAVFHCQALNKADAGSSPHSPTGSGVGPYPSAQESSFLTPLATSAGPQALSRFMEDCPSSRTTEMMQNLFRFGIEGLKTDSHKQSTTENGESTKIVAEETCSQARCCSEHPAARRLPTCNVRAAVILLRGICGLGIYWGPGVWVMTAAGDCHWRGFRLLKQL